MDNHNNPRLQLLALVEELKLPICPTDTMQYIQNLTDEEVETLLPSFEYVKAYQEGVEKKAREIDPAQAKNIDEEYRNKTHDLFERMKHEILQVKDKYDQELQSLRQTHAIN